MNFDPSKVIERPVTLTEGRYYFEDNLNYLIKDVEEGGDGLHSSQLNGDWKYFYPIFEGHTNTHRTKHRRVLAPLYLRMKK